jgi:hypothetical protein
MFIDVGMKQFLYLWIKATTQIIQIVQVAVGVPCFRQRLLLGCLTMEVPITGLPEDSSLIPEDANYRHLPAMSSLPFRCFVAILSCIIVVLKVGPFQAEASLP